MLMCVLAAAATKVYGLAAAYGAAGWPAALQTHGHMQIQRTGQAQAYQSRTYCWLFQRSFVKARAESMKSWLKHAPAAAAGCLSAGADSAPARPAAPAAAAAAQAAAGACVAPGPPAGGQLLPAGLVQLS